MACKRLPVTRLVEVDGLVHCGLGCLAQRPDPSRTSALQPGCVQGFGAAVGMGQLEKENPHKTESCRGLDCLHRGW